MSQPIVAVTGATGFIGRRIVRALIGNGYAVRALARRSPAKEEADASDAVSWVLGSLADQTALHELVKDTVAVVHAAGAIKALNRDGFLAVNRDGTRRLAEAALRRAVPPRFIYLSSIAAREPRLSAYAASKRAGEQAVRALQPVLPAVILRPPAVYGPGDMETLKIFQMAARGFLVAPMVAGARTSLVHVDDVAGAVMAALALKDLPDTPVEFDDGKAGAYAWSEIAAAAGEALRTRPRLIRLPAAVLYMAGAAASLSASLTRRPTVLSWGKVPELLHPDWVAAGGSLPGYKPGWTLEKGFKNTVSWYTSRGLLTS
ncbi:MAG: SDR family NAD(P)-dependent oxidoreductase [Rhodospirillaceae bacterium]|nr:SDR family NAD(P)-dependent oxidoreductase [Rhodospirillaceae bacterium]